MRSFHVKKGDEVVVMAGADKGKRGRIISVDGKHERVYVQGVRMIKKHMRKNQQYPNGTILSREGSIHVSNVVKAELFDAKALKRAPAPAKA